jgi:cytochrome c oxidase subunit 6a
MFFRRFTSTFPSYEKTMLKEAYEAKVHAEGSTKMWEKINLFLVFPTLALVGYFTLPKELNHIHHIQEHPKEYIAWPHLRKRKNVSYLTQEFPWGDDALFHNEAFTPSPPKE